MADKFAPSDIVILPNYLQQAGQREAKVTGRTFDSVDAERFIEIEIIPNNVRRRRFGSSASALPTLFVREDDLKRKTLHGCPECRCEKDEPEASKSISLDDVEDEGELDEEELA